MIAIEYKRIKSLSFIISVTSQKWLSLVITSKISSVQYKPLDNDLPLQKNIITKQK